MNTDIKLNNFDFKVKFELYYDEYERVKRDKEASYTLDQICKEVGIGRHKEPPKNKPKK